MNVDLLVTGRIASLAGVEGFGWVEALAIRGGRIVLVGGRTEVETAVGAVGRRLDLPPDRAVLPGLTDAHLHLADLALAAEEVDLAGAMTLDDGLRRIGAAAAAMTDPDAWLTGHGWDAARWGGWPTAAVLERVAPGRRVALWSHDHHAVWASARALREAGLEAGTDDPPGGVIRRLEDGQPAGCLHERAVSLVLRLVPPPSPDRLEGALVRACRALLGLGLVAVHDPGEVSSDVTLDGGFAAYGRLAAAGRLPIRVHASVRAESLGLALERGLRSGAPLGEPQSRARMGWLKLFADGTLGARTARLLAPYEPDPGAGEPPGGPLGVEVTPSEEITRAVARAAAGGIASQVHAIGDGAVRTSLDALAPVAGRTPLRPRIEHAQLIDPADLPRFAGTGIAACVQPRDLRADAANAYRHWGPRRVERGGYAYRSLLRSGALVVFGTDAPVEPPDPWPAIASAVSRRSPEWGPDEPPFVTAEALTLAQAIRAACLGPALVAGETDRGRLTRGCRADLVIVPAAALREPVEPDGALETTRPELVLVDGQVVHEA